MPQSDRQISYIDDNAVTTPTTTTTTATTTTTETDLTDNTAETNHLETAQQRSQQPRTVRAPENQNLADEVGRHSSKKLISSKHNATA